MDNIDDIISKIENIIKTQESSERIKAIINTIYSDYRDSFKRYLSQMFRIVEGNPKCEEKLLNLRYEIEKDFDEMKITIDTIQIAEEDSRKNNLQEYLIPTIRRMGTKLQEKKENTDVLDASFLLDENTEQTEKQSNTEMIESAIIGKTNNFKYTNEIKNNLVSELKSSQNMIIHKMQEIITPNIDTRKAQMIFEEDINLIINNTILKSGNIRQILDERDQNMSKCISEIWDEFCKQTNKEETAKQQKDAFRERLSEGVHVDEEIAKRKVEEAKIENKDKLNVLPDNLIE